MWYWSNEWKCTRRRPLPIYFFSHGKPEFRGKRQDTWADFSNFQVRHFQTKGQEDRNELENKLEVVKGLVGAKWPMNLLLNTIVSNWEMAKFELKQSILSQVIGQSWKTCFPTQNHMNPMGFSGISCLLNQHWLAQKSWIRRRNQRKSSIYRSTHTL